MAIDLMTVINFLKETVINLATKKHLDWLIEMHSMTDSSSMRETMRDSVTKILIKTDSDWLIKTDSMTNSGLVKHWRSRKVTMMAIDSVIVIVMVKDFLKVMVKDFLKVMDLKMAISLVKVKH